MKKVLITGKNSYIGNALEKWLAKEPENYQVESIDMKDGSWKQRDFSIYDVVFHTAGIAHIKESLSNQELYYKVNRDLAYETAKKAKNAGVQQFIFLSSMSVYGIEQGIINKLTPVKPKTAYGKSKLQAEELISSLETYSFHVAILRPPMVYGKGCKGNYQKLAKIARKTPVFPKIDNKRSMIYIDYLSEFIKQIIINKGEGLFFPQNPEYVNTTEMVRIIAEVNSKRIIVTRCFNILLKLINSSVINKVFGDLVYDKSMSYDTLSDFNEFTRIKSINFYESIKNTEKME